MIFNLNGLKRHFLSHYTISTDIFSIKPITNYRINSEHEIVRKNCSWSHSNMCLAEHLCLSSDIKDETQIGLTKEEAITLGLMSLHYGEKIIIDYNNSGIE